MMRECTICSCTHLSDEIEELQQENTELNRALVIARAYMLGQDDIATYERDIAIVDNALILGNKEN